MNEMTEAEWLRCDNPEQMLWFLRGRASPRKLRLFACACVRLVWALVDETGRRTTETIERDPDGRTARRNRLVRGARQARMQFPFGEAAASASAAVAAVLDPDPFIAAQGASRCAWLASQSARAADAATPDEANTAIQAASAECRAAQAALLRDLFVPFRPGAALPTWLEKCTNGARLAKTAYDERDFALLPILADALEEDGCEEDVVSHLRGPGPHIRGCWALDLVLGNG
jgi:hypothetical protein